MDSQLYNIIESQIQFMAGNFKTYITLSVSWYTFFVTMNLAALAFAIKPTKPRFIAIVFILLNILGSISSYQVKNYFSILIGDIYASRKAKGRRAESRRSEVTNLSCFLENKVSRKIVVIRK